jgi:sugar-specific transcriptional regulator TrmB
MLNEQLKALGLDKYEIEAYLAALELGPSSILQIAKKAKQNRAQLYRTVQTLIEKKMFSITIKGKKKLYVAEAPTVLREILKSKMSALEEILPDLLALSSGGKIKPVIKFYEGLEGIEDVYMQSSNAKDKKIISFIGVERLNSASKALLNFWEKKYAPTRKKNGVFANVIVPDTTDGQEFRKKDNEFFRKTKLVPSSTYNFESEFMIYEDYSLIFVYSKNEQFAISIKSEAIANTFKMIWHIVWNQAY